MVFAALHWKFSRSAPRSLAPLREASGASHTSNSFSAKKPINVTNKKTKLSSAAKNQKRLFLRHNASHSFLCAVKVQSIFPFEYTNPTKKSKEKQEKTQRSWALFLPFCCHSELFVGKQPKKLGLAPKLGKFFSSHIRKTWQAWEKKWVPPQTIKSQRKPRSQRS